MFFSPVYLILPVILIAVFVLITSSVKIRLLAVWSG